MPSERIKKYHKRLALEKLEGTLFQFKILFVGLAVALLWMGFQDLAAPSAPWVILGGCVCGYIAYSMIRLKSWLRWVLRGGPPLMICAILSRSLGVQDPWVAILSVTGAALYVAARSTHERDLFQDAGLVDDAENAEEPEPNSEL